jgi:Sulfotransferase family
VSAPPLIVLGVRRSGTTLLRVMLDRSPQLAVPDESYFLPQLAHRHGDRPNLDEFQDDLRRLPTLREWELSPEDVRARLRPGMTLGQAVGAVYETYAAQRGKTRWGDKTPMYMQYLPLLERLFPDARYVHLIRDGRDAALSFLQMPEGVVTKTWAHPRDAAGFACQWRTEVAAARALGRRVGPERYLELRYEELVEDPDRELRRTCTFAELPFEREMLAYAGNVDVSHKPHQQSLKRPPTPGLRDWRNAMSPDDAAAFQEIAADLLANLGYPLADDAPREPTARGRRRLASYRALTAAWRASAYALQRSPLWRRRHPPLT